MKRVLRRWFLELGMASKIAACGVLVTILAVGATGWLAYSSARESLAESAIKQLRESSERQAERITFELASIRDDARYLAASLGVQSLLRADRGEGQAAERAASVALWRERLNFNFGTLIHSRAYREVSLISARDGRQLCLTLLDEQSDVGFSARAATQLQTLYDLDYVQHGLALAQDGMYVAPMAAIDSRLPMASGASSPAHAGLIQRFVTPVYSSAEGTQARARSLNVADALAKQIMGLDASLTHAARQAAESGDLAWELLYEAEVLQLEAALEAALEFGGEAVRQALSEVSEANDALIGMELRAFEWVRAGKLSEASGLMHAADYLEHKARYGAGIQRMLENLKPELIGLVVIGVESDYITNQLDESRVLKSSVLDEAGRNLRPKGALGALGVVLGSQSVPVALRKDSAEVWARLAHSKRAHVILDDDRFLVSTPIPLGSDVDDASLTLVVCQDVDQLMASANRLGLRVLLVDLLACCLMGCLGVYLARRITRPLLGLAAKADQLAKGEAGVEFHAGSGVSEVARLETAFSNLVESLCASTHRAQSSAHAALEAKDELSHLNSELERKVIERTEQLELALLSAENASMAKSDFLATMSHEIRTPMNGVIGMTSILLESQLSGDQRECAETVRGSAEALLSIINDILDYSKVESGKLELEVIEFDPLLVVEEALGLLAAKVQAKGVELLADLDEALPRSLRGDPCRLRQVLINLLGNAAKFTDQGEIVLSIQARQSSAGQHRLAFSVRDTGIGIPAQAQAGLFDKFTQVDGSTTRKFGGTGLGLAICRQLVQLMCGEIQVKSELGSGAEFSFEVSFPAGAAPSEQLPEARPLRQALLVESQASAARVSTSILSARGYRVSHEPDSSKALARLQEASQQGRGFDLVLVTGSLAVAEELRNGGQPEDPGLIILLDAAGFSRAPDEAARMLALKNVIRLSKPLRRSLLDERLAMRSESLQRPADAQLALRSARDKQPSPGALEGAGLYVLLVEDNRVNQMVASRMLTALGCRVDVVNDGCEGVEAVRKQSYDVIFMDCQMPRMDGFEATRVIRNDIPGGELLVIVAMTANAMQGDRERCLESGMDDYISKPVHKQDLGQALQRYRLRRSA